MKKYPISKEFDQLQREARQLKCDELKTFQFLLRHSEQLKAQFGERAEAIAYGLQPWIDALEEALKK